MNNLKVTPFFLFSACQFYGFIGGLFGLMSIITLAAISIDRYYNIAEPLKAAKNMTKRKAFMMIIVVWIWSLVWSVPPIFGWGAYIPEGFQTSCTFDYLTRETHVTTFIIGMYIGGFVFPLFIIVVSYVLIWKAIRKHDKEMLKMAKKMKVEDIRANQEKTKAEVRIAKIAMMIVFLYLLSWTPYAIVALIGQFGPADWVTPYVSELPVMFAKAAAMHNPVVYAFSHPRFRDALNKRVPWLMCCCDVKPTTSTPNSANHSRSTKRAVSREVSNDSYYVGGEDVSSDVSSCISHVDDYGRTIEMRQAVSDTSFTRQSRSGGPGNHAQDSGLIVRELIQALVTVSNRPPVGQPKQSTKITSQDNLQIATDSKGTYVVENGKQIDVTTYVQQLVASGKIPGLGDKTSNVSPNIEPKDKSPDSNIPKDNTDKVKPVKSPNGDNERNKNETEKNVDACYTNPTFEKDIEVPAAPKHVDPDDGRV